jgi:spore maturation protein CgeB
MACGIPLLSAPWQDAEGLFNKNQDFRIAHNGIEMTDLINKFLNDDIIATRQAENALSTILQNHTCVHRVNELELILKNIGMDEEKIFSQSIN